MGSCLSSSVAVVEPEVLKVIESAVESAVHAALTQLLSDMHLSVILAKEGQSLTGQNLTGLFLTPSKTKI